LGGLCEDEAISKLGWRSSPTDTFETIVTRHMKDAYFIALGLVGNHEDALELSQEAFLRAFGNFKQLKSTGKFFPWQLRYF
jgi:RNA polymerase sigma-70 factor (ECF subfamily)